MSYLHEGHQHHPITLLNCITRIAQCSLSVFCLKISGPSTTTFDRYYCVSHIMRFEEIWCIFPFPINLPRLCFPKQWHILDPILPLKPTCCQPKTNNNKSQWNWKATIYSARGIKVNGKYHVVLLTIGTSSLNHTFFRNTANECNHPQSLPPDSICAEQS